MALLFNVQRTAGLIGRRLGGIESAHSIAGNFRPERENWFYGAHSPDRTGGTPNGHLPPSSWVLPQKAGGLSSINFAGLTINGSALGALGVRGRCGGRGCRANYCVPWMACCTRPSTPGAIAR